MSARPDDPKKRIPCDVCRRKKRRCDGAEPCGNCIQHEFTCTYHQRETQRTTAPSSSRRVQHLENRLHTVEALLNTPGSSPASTPKNGYAIRFMKLCIQDLNSFDHPDTDDLDFSNLAKGLGSLSLNNRGNYGFQGKSSAAVLVRAAEKLKSSNSRSTVRDRLPQISKPWTINPFPSLIPHRTPKFDYPPDDLLPALVELYFAHINNLFFPLLHRPTFERALAAQLHLQDEGFAGTLLLVCALGARYSSDPRVCPSGASDVAGMGKEMAGYDWFAQVKLPGAGQPLVRQPSLYELQCYCLAVQYLDRVAGARACWTLVGFGVRLGQDIGAHRIRIPPGTTITPEEELEKRAYWIMVVFDTQLSTALGRPISIQSHDIDLDLPMRCDDKYWNAPERPFTQPADTPTCVDFLVCELGLNKIIAFALKILYCTQRAQAMIGLTGEHWEEQIVVELDGALNKWFKSVPDHLRWHPAREDDVCFDQSAALYCSYYLAQIIIHRPFIPAIRPSQTVHSTFPSLTVCNNAARACSHIADMQQRRRPDNPLVFGQTAVFTAGIVLLLNAWGTNRTRPVKDEDLADVRRCMRVLREYKSRWPAVGPSLDILEQLLKVDRVRSHSGLEADWDFGPSPFVDVASSPPREDIVPPDRVSVAGADVPDGWPAYDARLETPLDEADLAFFDNVEGDTSVDSALFATAGFNEGNFGEQDFGLETYNNSDMSLPNDVYMDTVAIWSSAPNGFEVSDWDLYLNSIGMDMGDAPDAQQAENEQRIPTAWI
ncbi:fungal-specific transcription factor domain-containing protein [Mycena crocata]|nr:fungal-specific transcription factor domain-containing protein [Mycena crocata]